MSLAARLKMFEQAASDNAAGMRPGSAATKARPTWGAARGPSLADQIKQVRAPVPGTTCAGPFASLHCLCALELGAVRCLASG
jgi:hypothetical protein